MKKIVIILIIIFLPIISFCQIQSKNIGPEINAPTKIWENGRKYALVIGISKYLQENIPQLKYTVNDASAIVQFLKNESYIKYDEVILLTDALATRENIIRKLCYIADKISPQDTFLIYYSGHGKEEYLIPYDGDKDCLEATGIRWQEDIYSKINKIDVKQKILIIDSCHSGSLALNIKGSRGGASVTSNLNDQILKQIGHGIFVITSSRDTELSYENDEIKHGYFTYYFIEGLKGQADTIGDYSFGNNDGYVTADELYNYVSSKTNKAVINDFNKPQHPRKSFSGEGMIVLSKINASTSFNTTDMVMKNMSFKLEKKSNFLLEYDDFSRDIYDKITDKKISANYQSIFLKYDYNFNELFSLYLRAGGLRFASPQQYGEASFAFEGGAKINIAQYKNINLDIRAENLYFENSSSELKRKTNWNEFRAGTAITYSKYKLFEPYIGLYRLYVKGKFDYKDAGLIRFTEYKKLQEFFTGIKLNGDKIYFTAEMRVLGDLSNIKSNVDGYRVGVNYEF